MKGVPPFVPSAGIEDELRNHCTLNGQLRKLRVRNVKPIYDHIETYTRQVPILLKTDEIVNLPSHIDIKYKDITYKIRVELGSQRCHRCKQEGHFVKNCPSTVPDQEEPSTEQETGSGQETSGMDGGNSGEIDEQNPDLLNADVTPTGNKRRRDNLSVEPSPNESSPSKPPRNKSIRQNPDDTTADMTDLSFGDDSQSQRPKKKNPANVFAKLREIQLGGIQHYTTDQIVNWLELFLRSKSYEPKVYNHTLKILSLDNHNMKKALASFIAKVDPTWGIHEKIEKTLSNWPIVQSGKK